MFEVVGMSSDDYSVESIGQLPLDLFAESCQQVMMHLQGQIPGVDTAELCERFQKAGVQLNLEAVEKIVNIVLFLFRTATKSNWTAGQLVTKLAERSGKWSKPALQVIQRIWNEQGKLLQSQEDPSHMITVGQLVDFQWKLAMAVSSDTCRSLNYPYISMTLKVANSSGQITSKSFEMTIPQFQNFFRQFKEMAAVLETV
ncbi:COMM domain-containing protein 6-like isoform X1 [Acipenser oxyrinchus oxyrinchus]|uniref:COMM domain-containing protein 6 n=1 Tax=Acipenser oxyrinchus oxyrinchus TaxID=40147 RepID=A0AAD8G964_ACIOX|nr:COMM domain-containing protein 6-like isoform X1 [Acipenser oxyrinchus oxyrinchus]